MLAPAKQEFHVFIEVLARLLVKKIVWINAPMLRPGIRRFCVDMSSVNEPPLQCLLHLIVCEPRRLECFPASQCIAFVLVKSTSRAPGYTAASSYYFGD